MKLNIGFVAILLLLIGGCSFAPGYNTPVEIPPNVNIILITSEVIAEQLAKSAKKQDCYQGPAESAGRRVKSSSVNS